jgi:hypothetical protein
MSIVAIILAVILGLLALKFIAGMAKFAVLAVIILGALYFAGVFN